MSNDKVMLAWFYYMTRHVMLCNVRMVYALLCRKYLLIHDNALIVQVTLTPAR